MAFSIALDEELGPDNSVPIDQHGPRVWNALGLAFGFLIEQSVGLDRLASGIGEQWECDFSFVGKFVQGIDWIVADCDEGNPGGLNLG
jgi:hypothetical protein